MYRAKIRKQKPNERKQSTIRLEENLARKNKYTEAGAQTPVRHVHVVEGAGAVVEPSAVPVDELPLYKRGHTFAIKTSPRRQRESEGRTGARGGQAARRYASRKAARDTPAQELKEKTFCQSIAIEPVAPRPTLSYPPRRKEVGIGVSTKASLARERPCGGLGAGAFYAAATAAAGVFWCAGERQAYRHTGRSAPSQSTMLIYLLPIRSTYRALFGRCTLPIYLYRTYIPNTYLPNISLPCSPLPNKALPIYIYLLLHLPPSNLPTIYRPTCWL